MPPRILEDLGASVRLARRSYSSYTPDPFDGGRSGLLVGDGSAFADFYRSCRQIAGPLWPTLTGPLPTRSAASKLAASEAAWRSIVEEPIGHAIRRSTPGDTSRGVIATDALIGTFADLDDSSLRQNACLLYHVLGGGTGDWDVPVGGMGTVTAALAGAAQRYGVEICTGAEVFAVDPDGEVRYRVGDDEHRTHGRYLLAGVTPTVLAKLLGDPEPETMPGSQVKVNVMLRRLPRLRDSAVSAEQAFAGTFHVNESFTQLQHAYRQANRGTIPDPLPCEAYCHSLTDPTILSPQLRTSGAHTLTVFGLHTPHGQFDGPHLRERLTAAVLGSLNSVLAEPIEDLLLTDDDGAACIETKTTADLEDALAMTAGHIFHGGLTWPFAEDDEPLDTPARRWGVGTRHERVLLCGSGARRGGGVSGIAGHNAAMAVLAAEAGTC